MKTRKLRAKIKRKRKIRKRKYKKTRRGGVKKSILKSPEQRKKTKRRARFNSEANVTHEFRSPKLTREQKIMRIRTRRQQERKNKNQVKIEKRRKKKTRKAMASRHHISKDTGSDSSSTSSKNLAAKGRELAIRSQKNPDEAQPSSAAAAAAPETASPPRAPRKLSMQMTPPRHSNREKGNYTPPTRVMTSKQLEEFFNAMK